MLFLSRRAMLVQSGRDSVWQQGLSEEMRRRTRFQWVFEVNVQYIDSAMNTKPEATTSMSHQLQ